jgi:hypothetical protein
MLGDFAKIYTVLEKLFFLVFLSRELNKGFIVAF